MAIIINSGTLQSVSLLSSGYITSGCIIPGSMVSGMPDAQHPGVGALVSGSFGSGSISSGNIASGIAGEQCCQYYKQIGVHYAISKMNTTVPSTRIYWGGDIAVTGQYTSLTPSDSMRVYCVPFTASRSGAIAKVGIRVQGAAGDGRKCQIGIYDSGPDYYPTTLLNNTSQMPMSGGGYVVSEATNWAICPNHLYWLAYVQGSGNAISIRAYNNNLNQPAPLFFYGLDSNLISTPLSYLCFRDVSGTFPLPNPYPTTSGWTSGIAGNTPIIGVWF